MMGWNAMRGDVHHFNQRHRSARKRGSARNPGRDISWLELRPGETQFHWLTSGCRSCNAGIVFADGVRCSHEEGVHESDDDN